MRIGPVAIVVLLVLAVGAGWFVLQNGGLGVSAPGRSPPPQPTPAISAEAAAPLSPDLERQAGGINGARFDPANAANYAAATDAQGGPDPAPSATDQAAPAAATTGSASGADATSDAGAASGSGAADTALDARTAGTRVDPALLRAQVLLDRAHFSPGAIDGRNGENTVNALRAYERARGFDPDGRLDAQVYATLTADDSAPVVRGYRITDQDVRGPFNPDVPIEARDMRGLDRVPYRDAAEALAEKFHMSEALLRQLNPGADFAQAGSVILVAATGSSSLQAQVDRIEVDRDRVQVRAYAGDRLVALYPATVGSADFPSPQGQMTVTSVAPNPTYTWDPRVLTFGRERNGASAFTVPAGPNNPVGSTWIDLSEPTYGIHGTPDPDRVGKTASHGCVRLTNWDAAQLGRAVRSGAQVTFVGTRTGGQPAARAAQQPAARS